MGKLSFKGIIIGGIADVVLTSILGIPLTIYIISTLNLSHTPQDQISSVIISAIHANSSFHVAQLLIGLSCSMLGGYIAAWIAKHDELLNGGLSSFFCLAIGVYSFSSGKISVELWEKLLEFIASPVFALIGGYLRIVKIR